MPKPHESDTASFGDPPLQGKALKTAADAAREPAQPQPLGRETLFRQVGPLVGAALLVII